MPRILIFQDEIQPYKAKILILQLFLYYQYTYWKMQFFQVFYKNISSSVLL